MFEGRRLWTTLALLVLSLCVSISITTAEAVDHQVLTPVILAVQDAPVPFAGSDGRIHLVYELWMTNFSSVELAVKQVQVIGDGKVLQTLGANDIAARLQPAGQRTSTGTMTSGTQSLLFIHVILNRGARPPRHLSHRVAVTVHGRNMSENGGTAGVNARRVAVVGPPLRGANYISADSCCDATRHTRAALPINGRVWVAQRYAVDWEQLDSSNRIYAGPRDDVRSYRIYGAKVLAVADAVVVTAVDGLPNQKPGEFPSDLPIEQADGNHVILDLGGGNYALYAHLKPGSVAVHKGQRVRRGEMLALVGNSGNTIAPHLHFQLMDRPLSLAANGLPYEINVYQIEGATPGTRAFDEAEANGKPLAIEAGLSSRHVRNALPLDQQIISFSP